MSKIILVLLVSLYGACFLWAEDTSEKVSVPLLNKDEPLEVLIGSLWSKDFTTRHRAIEFIRIRGAEAKGAVPALMRLLEQGQMIESAVICLRDIGPSAEAAIPVLFKAFTVYPRNPAARWNAAHALANMGELARPTLTKGIKSKNIYEEFWSRAALAKIDGVHSEHFRFLIDAMLTDTEPRVSLAVRGLSMIGPELTSVALPEFLDALERPLMRERNSSRSNIVSLFGRMKKDAIPAIPKLVQMLDVPDKDGWKLSFRAVQALGQIGGAEAKAAVPSLLRMLENDKEHHRWILGTLGAIGPEARDALPQLIALLSKKELKSVERNWAAMSLLHIAPDNADVRSAIVGALKEGDRDLRGYILQGLITKLTPTKEWIRACVELHEAKILPQMYLRRLYFKASPDNKKLFPEKSIKPTGFIAY